VVVVVFLHHVVPPLPFFVARIVVIIVSLATTNDDSVLRDAIVSLVFLLLLRHFSTLSLEKEKCPDLRQTRAFIYVCVINKKRERIDTNERERAPSFFATTFDDTRAVVVFQKARLRFTTHTRRLCENDASFFSLRHLPHRSVFRV